MENTPPEHSGQTPHLYSRQQYREILRKGGDVEVRPFDRDSWLRDQEKVHELMELYMDEHLARLEAHRIKIAAIARRLGQAVTNHEMTRAHADRRLDVLIHEEDPDFPVRRSMLPEAEATAIVDTAFNEGACSD